MSRRSWGLFAAVSVLWGVPYLFVGIALDEGIGPGWIAAGRVLLAALVLAPLIARYSQRSQLAGHWGRLAVLALVQVVIPFSLISRGEEIVSSGTAGVLIATEPIFVLVIGVMLKLRGRPKAVGILGLILGFGGVFVLSSEMSGAFTGTVLLILAAGSYALGAVLVARWFSQIPPTVVVAGMIILAAPALLVVAVSTEGLPAPTWAGVGALAALGIVSTPLGFLAFFALIAYAGADRAALTAYVAPVVAVLAGMIVLAEPIGPHTLTGAALILVGAWLAARERVPAVH